MPDLLTRLLFAATCATVLLAAWLSGSQLPWGFEPGPSHPAWVERYESLAEPLAGELRALFVQQAKSGGAHRFFRAQFVLAPLVIHDLPSIDVVTPQQLSRAPLILDYRRPRALRKTLEQLAATAEEAGLELEVERLRSQLAIARLRTTER